MSVALVASTRKIADLIWQLMAKEAPYQWTRPDFVAMKMQKLELRACAARVHGPARPGRNYGINEIFHREMELVAQAESAYA
jgi:transposase